MIERFAVPDELTSYYDRPAEPSNVHVEARVPGRLDAAHVRAAVRGVLMTEPRVRARRVAASRWRHSYYWEVPPVPDVDPVRVASYADEADLARQRAAFLSESPSLDSSPPLLFLLASGPGGDCLILNAHHACLDGLACLRLLWSVAQEYATLAPLVLAGPVPAGPVPAGPVPAGPPASSGERTPSQRASGPADGAPAAARARARAGMITRIAPRPGDDQRRSRPGYGAYLLTWDGLPAVDWLRITGCSVNDLLITTLMITISEWNERHGGRPGPIRITMPIGERSQAGRDGQWSNMSRLAAVTARVSCDSGALDRDLLEDVASQTRYAKEHPGPQLDLASRALAAAPIPVAVKGTFLRAALRVAGPLLCDTALVSNLGVAEPPCFGAVAATEVWFSTSAHMPRGLSLGAITVGGRLRLTFRYRRALFSDAGAAEFGARYGEVLDHLAGRGAWS